MTTAANNNKMYASVKFDRGDIISINSKVLSYPNSEGFWVRYKPANLPCCYVGAFGNKETAFKSANRISDYRGVVYCSNSGFVSELEIEGVE